VAGVGVVGLLLAAPGVSANEGAKHGSAASGHGHDSSAASTDAEKASERTAAGTHELSGKVEKFDREKRTLSLADSDKKLKVTDDTEVTKDGDKVSPGQIMEGDEVRASYSGSGDEVEVLSIEVSSSDLDAGSTSTQSAQ
jgi:hypothetical protein